MKKTVQSYLIFTTIPLRIALLLLALLAAVTPAITQLVAMNGMKAMQQYYILWACVSAELLLVGEMMLDRWSFGGITAKDGGLPLCLNTSSCGLALVKNAVRVNMARQFVTEALVILFTGILFSCYTKEAFWNGSSLLTGLAIALLVYVFTILGVTVTRFFSALHIQLFLVLVTTVLFGFSAYIFMFGMLPAIVVLAILSITVSIISEKTVMKKGKDSYYDKAD